MGSELLTESLKHAGLSERLRAYPKLCVLEKVYLVLAWLLANTCEIIHFILIMARSGIYIYIYIV